MPLTTETPTEMLTPEPTTPQIETKTHMNDHYFSLEHNPEYNIVNFEIFSNSTLQAYSEVEDKIISTDIEANVDLNISENLTTSSSDIFFANFQINHNSNVTSPDYLKSGSYSISIHDTDLFYKYLGNIFCFIIFFRIF